MDWFYVTGATTQDPPWRMLFANLCSNQWEITGPVWSYTASAGDAIYNYDNCQLEQGKEVFWDYSGGVVVDTAERDLVRDEGPGYHVTNYFWWKVVHNQGGGGVG
ncbi:MAG TPA: hypothetical protein VMI31_16945 [Fimbriimonadaceae bacterium]|nr:hypothetical protein [Fimbriimonadaceae bacterium]